MALTIFVITLGISLYGLFVNPELVKKLALRPEQVYYDRKWYMVLTSGFVHADLGHLAFNMITYFFFAFRLEQILGSSEFTVLYLGSIIIADLPSVFDHKDDPEYLSLGASGGISAVLFSYVLFDPMSTLYLYFLIPVPAVVFAVGYLGYCAYAARYSVSHINHRAHLWGALAGIGFTLLLSPYIRQEVFEGMSRMSR